ncbi:MAG: hypothetical protein HZA53_04320 [Planctomycetes bacterium]|nr:hypothetical protein [Planctomycetota bacterium]
MARPRPTTSLDGDRKPSSRTWELAGIAGLVLLAAYFLGVSWRKWPDPLTDFGRELYMAWRLSEGGVLYRDVDEYYGPLSQYLNVALFECFGPGLMVLVTANLVVFAAIAGVLYALLRHAFGVGAALAGSAVFVAVFGFSQLVGIGNYNYATPYVHSATHGMLVILWLAFVLERWVREPRAGSAFVAGLLFGCTAILKPEFMLAGCALMLAALALRLRRDRRSGLRALPFWALGAVLPTLGFVLHFARCMPWSDAVLSAGKAWSSVLTTMRFSKDPSQLQFLGFDHPGANLASHGFAAGAAFLLIAGLAVGVQWAERVRGAAPRMLLASALVGGIAWLAIAGIEWIQVGRSFLGLTLAYAVFTTVSVVRSKPGDEGRVSVPRALLCVLAVTLLARMLLNGRVYHFGFYQAALAGVFLTAVLVGELPRRVASSAFGRQLAIVCGLTLLVPGVVRIAQRSEGILRLKTQAVGDGVDRFYAYPPNMDPTAEMVRELGAWLRTTPSGNTALVLPSGPMVNYLGRRFIPVPETLYFAGHTADGQEARIVETLKQHPPDWVVFLSLDLREFGIQRYGEAPGKGKLIVDWVHENYVSARTMGGDPLDGRRRGFAIWQPRTER